LLDESRETEKRSESVEFAPLWQEEIGNEKWEMIVDGLLVLCDKGSNV